MRVTAVSHSCVVDANQGLFIDLNETPGVDVELIVPGNWRNEYTNVVERCGVLPTVTFPVHALPVIWPGRIHLYRFKHGLEETIRGSAPDVIFLDEEPWSLAAAQVVGVARRLGVPLVCYTKQNMARRYPPPFCWIERRTYRSAASMLALTEESRRVLREKGFGGRVWTLPHGYDPSVFFSGPNRELAAQLGLSGTVVGFLGRFAKVKGLHVLVEAVRRLLARRPGLEFTVLMVGSGPTQRSVMAEIARHGLRGRFVFAGPVAHLAAGDYLRAMDLLVVPSVNLPRAQEQFGRVIVEAMACEVPVVGSTSGNIPHLIEQTGGGQTFRESDPADLAAVLGPLIDDAARRRRLGQAGAAGARKHFTQQVVARRLGSILESCLRGARSKEGQGPIGVVASREGA